MKETPYNLQVEQHGLQLHQNQQIPEQYLVQIPAKYNTMS
jgi:hypothetical protein